MPELSPALRRKLEHVSTRDLAEYLAGRFNMESGFCWLKFVFVDGRLRYAEPAWKLVAKPRKRRLGVGQAARSERP